ncbi:sulfite exporter TauE/SafE family protein [Rhodocytophaga rosea]|uniref:Probable membrane transporter protein n=1 Tax=Rhodocytophaga rosea TaxID=2704465 RepID=A0A6C0GT27_9BACT|nr:sulfite exporter TauE/SafE family protein [Rhodocytophaga rosea]QHT71318.1 sulfite exporter TauE/SafE family protein [Rhodocytophaga rosea]
MEIIGYVASACIGISLGLIGSGGSILTVPVLVYLFHVEPTLATAYSLFIVGSTALVGGIQSSLQHRVDLRTALVFSIPSFIAVFITRRFLVPYIPHELFSIGSLLVTKDIAIMVFFAFIMMVVAIGMIRSQRETPSSGQDMAYNYPLIVLEGFVVGILTGLVGAGGGFLIIPALVLLSHLPMKKAVGTSLLIIAAKSLIGFLGDIGSGQHIDFVFLISISIIAITGLFVGSFLSKFIHGHSLKTAFGWFVLVMGVYIVLRETVFLP